MKAVKNNKEYTITEQEKAHYLAIGYDILDDEGNTIEHGKGKTVPYEQYAAVVKELEQLKASVVGNDGLSEKTVEELKEYAKEHNIDLGQASSHEGILKKIRATPKE